MPLPRASKRTMFRLEMLVLLAVMFMIAQAMLFTTNEKPVDSQTPVDYFRSTNLNYPLVKQ